MTFELRCLFADIHFVKGNVISTELSCNAEYHSMKNNDTKVDSISGQYLGQKNKSDVVGLRMYFLSLVLLPTGISTYIFQTCKRYGLQTLEWNLRNERVLWT